MKNKDKNYLICARVLTAHKYNTNALYRHLMRVKKKKKRLSASIFLSERICYLGSGSR